MLLIDRKNISSSPKGRDISISCSRSAFFERSVGRHSHDLASPLFNLYNSSSRQVRHTLCPVSVNQKPAAEETSLFYKEGFRERGVVFIQGRVRQGQSHKLAASRQGSTEEAPRSIKKYFGPQNAALKRDGGRSESACLVSAPGKGPRDSAIKRLSRGCCSLGGESSLTKQYDKEQVACNLFRVPRSGSYMSYSHPTLSACSTPPTGDKYPLSASNKDNDSSGRKASCDRKCKTIKGGPGREIAGTSSHERAKHQTVFLEINKTRIVTEGKNWVSLLYKESLMKTKVLRNYVKKNVSFIRMILSNRCRRNLDFLFGQKSFYKKQFSISYV